MGGNDYAEIIRAMEEEALDRHHSDLAFAHLLAIATFVAGLVIGSFF